MSQTFAIGAYRPNHILLQGIRQRMECDCHSCLWNGNFRGILGYQIQGEPVTISQSRSPCQRSGHCAFQNYRWAWIGRQAMSVAGTGLGRKGLRRLRTYKSNSYVSKFGQQDIAPVAAAVHPSFHNVCWCWTSDNVLTGPIQNGAIEIIKTIPKSSGTAVGMTKTTDDQHVHGMVTGGATELCTPSKGNQAPPGPFVVHESENFNLIG